MEDIQINMISYVIIAILIIAIVLLLRKLKEKISSLKKYKPIIDIEERLLNVKDEMKLLNKDYKEGKITYDKLKSEIDLFESKFDLIESGVYEPVFDFGTSEEFKSKILENKSEQKMMIRNKDACWCNTEWTVDGSKVEGRKKTNQTIRLTLRAFNGECDSLVAKVKWNNVDGFIKRIDKSFEMINKFNFTSKIFLSEDFLRLRKDELRLTYEYNLKKYEEKEEERKKRALIREEEKAKRDFEIAQKEEEKNEKIYLKALEEAKKELGLANKEDVKKLNNQISKLEKQLSESKARMERAKSMAEQTKRGHVYVVSNVGSFGENIFKIGMTRRLDPYDRIKELGDASVPFIFDLHSLIYTDDAPSLESLLHNNFDKNRVNKVNRRKEYFRTNVENIEKCINDNFKGEFEFIKDIEAKEFKETESIILSEKGKKIKTKNEEYPDNLFLEKNEDKHKQ